MVEKDDKEPSDGDDGMGVFDARVRKTELIALVSVYHVNRVKETHTAFLLHAILCLLPGIGTRAVSDPLQWPISLP